MPALVLHYLPLGGLFPRPFPDALPVLLGQLGLLLNGMS